MDDVIQWINWNEEKIWRLLGLRLGFGGCKELAL